MYHRVAAAAVDPHGLAVSPAHFSQHLGYLQKTCHPMSLLDLVDAGERDALPPRAVAVTFDDGYVDNLTEAYPLLQTAQVPAVVFVTSGTVGSPASFFYDELATMLLVRAGLPEELSLDIQGQEHEWRVSTRVEREHAYYAVERLLRSLELSERDSILARIADWAGVERETNSECRPMTPRELVQLTADGLVEVGAHTVTHRILSNLSSRAQQAEIVDSGHQLERIVGKPVVSFAYPWGGSEHFTSETVEMVQRAGFRAACTTVHGPVESGDDPFRLRRCAVRDWDLNTFKRRLNSAFVA